MNNTRTPLKVDENKQHHDDLQMLRQVVYEFPDKHRKKNQKKLAHINPLLPQPHFYWLVSARRNSGKTQLLMNVIFNETFGYVNYFDRILIFCGSRDDAKRYKLLSIKHKVQDKVDVENTLDLEELNRLYDEYEEQQSGENLLVVLDDLIYANVFSRPGQAKNVLDRIAVNGRHIKWSIIVTTQKFRSINDIARKNATAITVFPSQSADMESIADEYHTRNIKPKAMLQMLNDYTDKRFHKITIDMERPPEERFRDNNFQAIDTTPYQT